MKRALYSEAKVVVIGGGTGSFVVLSGLKRYFRKITALVSMADDGGSTGQLRDELGALPPGDVRQCLVALSDSPRVRDLFNYRFEDGSLKGHAFGNLFLTALEKMTGSFAEAVEEASRVLAITGRVEPISLDPIHMTIETAKGKVIKGQFEGAHCDFEGAAKPQVHLEGSPRLNPAAKKAIEEADLIVIAPGSLYTSIAPALIVDGVSEALSRATAKKMYVCNLVTKPGQTDGFSVADYVSEIERFAGISLDYVIYNDSPPSPKLLEKYAHDHEYPVKVTQAEFVKAGYTAVGANLVARHVWTGASKADPIAEVRSYIRHDADVLARTLLQLYLR